MIDRIGTHFLTQNSFLDFQIRFFSPCSCKIHPITDSQVDFSYSYLGLKLVRIKRGKRVESSVLNILKPKY